MVIRGYEIAGRTIAYVVGGIVIVALALLLLSQCDKRRNEKAQSKVDAAQSEAATNSAADAINTVSEAGQREAASEDLTRQNERDIRAAPGAGDRVNAGVNAAGLQALCRRDAYRNTQRCKIFRKEPSDESRR
jgi:cell division septation protein DedD